MVCTFVSGYFFYMSIFNVQEFYKIMIHSNISFKANPIEFANKLPKTLKPVAKFISMQEGGDGLANTRFIQDTAVNWAPKAIFSRSLADFSEMSLLEFAESFLVYYGPKFVGEKLCRGKYSKNLDENLSKMVSKPASELAKKVDADKLAKLKPVKAALAVTALAIPLAEYSLNYIKNLFTLKVFKKADFNKIANLDKTQKEDSKEQSKVKTSAYKHLALAGGLLGGCLGLSALLLKRGNQSKALQHISDLVLMPGEKLFPKNEKKAATINKYFSLDFKDDNGKLGLSHGQLTACVLAGFFGYTGAAKDRGKQNLLEVLFRYPLVGFYVVTGSELLENGFKSMLNKLGKCQEVLKDGVPSMEELPKRAKELAKKSNGKMADQEAFNKLFKQKALITMVPFAFSIGFMGLFVAGVSRFFTQYRYNKDLEKNAKAQKATFTQTSIDQFKQQVRQNKSL